MLVVLGVVALIIAVSLAGALWRTRPQYANPRNEARFAFFVLILAAAGVMASGPHLGPYVIVAAPPALIAGWLLGRGLRSTLSFWPDPTSGRLKFRGGVLYFVILGSSALTRLSLRYLLTGSIASQVDPAGAIPQVLMVLASALLFADTGLYFARAQAIAAADGQRLSWRWLSMLAGRSS